MKGFIETYRGVVYPWHCGHQGHLNTMFGSLLMIAGGLLRTGNTSITGFYRMLPDDRADVMTQNIVERED